MNLNKFHANGNPFFTILADATDLHRSARQKHGDLLDLCKSAGVRFTDIHKYLLNQAKKSGLYRKTIYNPKIGGMDYPTVSSVKDLSWYTAMNNFCSWAKMNFKDYGVPCSRVAKKNVKVVTTVIRRPMEFKAPDNTLPLVPSTGNQVPESNDLSDMIVPPAKEASAAPKATGTAVTAPVESTLNTAQIQALILKNISVLGGIAEQKGCLSEFNQLMIALGMDEAVIEEDLYLGELQESLENAVQ